LFHALEKELSFRCVALLYCRPIFNILGWNNNCGVSDNSFACTMRMHVTMKGKGEMDMTELCVYSTKDGKIVKEEFFM